MSTHKAMTAVGINVRAIDVSGQAPEWIHLIPAGQVVGRDGREWVNDSPQLILAAFAARSVDLPLDLEHSTELKAPQGEPAPAVGWIKDLQARDGQIWGRVEWTEAGRNAVESKSYRYVSPVFVFERESKRVVSLTSAGLTNRPNLFLHALNKQELAIDAVIDKALSEGKIAPSSVEYHRAQCALEGGLERFEAYVNPQATLGDLGQVDGSQAGDKDKERNAEDLRIAELFGLTIEDLQKYGRQEEKGQTLNAEGHSISEMLGITVEDLQKYSLLRDKVEETDVDEHRVAVIFGNSPEDLQKFSQPKDKRMAWNAEEQRIAEIFGNTVEDLQKYSQPDGKGLALNAEELHIAKMFGNTVEDLQKFGQ